jgi:hypothetical protein
MKRKTFAIILNGARIDTRHTFNASNRAVVTHARDIAKTTQPLQQVESKTDRDEEGNGMYGLRVWQGMRNLDAVYRFEIRRVDE